jgi:hypothetical protein
MASLLFPSTYDLSDADLAKLAVAYELACDELVDDYQYTPEQLTAVIEPMTAALLDLYREGQKDEGQLSRYACGRALASAPQEIAEF